VLTWKILVTAQITFLEASGWQAGTAADNELHTFTFRLSSNEVLEKLLHVLVSYLAAGHMFICKRNELHM